MSAATDALRILAAGAEEYGARLVGRKTVELSKLGLYVRVPAAAVSSNPGAALFIGTIEASASSKPGIGITCVGLAPNPQGAVSDAVAQWCLGVLPVLVKGRVAAHTCLVDRSNFEIPTEAGPRTFDVLKGPLLRRGEREGGDETQLSQDAYLSLLSGALRDARLENGLHWLECYAVRLADGSVEATCRLDNRDWGPGKELSMADARGWPGTTASLDSRRQFLLFLPDGAWPEEPPPRSLWSRLLRREPAH